MEIRPAKDPRIARIPVSAPQPGAPAGGFVEFDGEVCYRIQAFHRMPPFFVSLPSDTDLWMFIASGGGLTCGRVDADGSLFPYLTVDQLHDAQHHTGPITLLRIEQESGDAILWEPFHTSGDEDPAIRRSLLKNATGNKLIFEEHHTGLDLIFRYSWAPCDEFGWVRSASIENLGDAALEVQVLDGLRNLLPFGAPLGLYQTSSTLVDAYKKTEVDGLTGLGIVSLTAGITDRAEALEVLRANTVWCTGLDEFRVHISLDTIANFRQGRVLAEEHQQNGGRAHYLVTSSLEIEAGATSAWRLIGDTGRDHLQIAALRRHILDDEDLDAAVGSALQRATRNLRHNVATADGLQISGRPESWVHHFANVLFNNMRGGVFEANYQVRTDDLRDFLAVRNREVLARHTDLLAELPERIGTTELDTRVAATGDADLRRLCLEYLPLHFGRRHGDPSRPWNRFNIHLKDEAGDPILHYEGNWRDIFQNWEALATSFPGFLPHMVAKFVNASTVDGYNPYRINREGVDWETVTPEDPWSNIGYWGDHQIIYLLKLLEAWRNHDPEGIAGLMHETVFSYAEVPYRIRPYAEIVANPSETIDFDKDLDRRIAARVENRGSDGKLLTGKDGTVHHATLLEKMLIPALAKLSNLVPDGGIWMNTQRPEWNDANNALAGGGISVVTLGYLRRYMAFLDELLGECHQKKIHVATEVADWLDGVDAGLQDSLKLMQGGPLNARSRKTLVDQLGLAFEAYRLQVYAEGFSGRQRALDTAALRIWCRTALDIIDLGLAANRREDGLFHTYNLLQTQGDEAEIRTLQPMLEGQVSILSSGYLKPTEALDILERLFASDMYREDQRTFMLYPAKTLPGFLARNTVPEDDVLGIPLLVRLLQDGNGSLVARDAGGTYRFAAGIGQVAALESVLNDLSDDPAYGRLVARDRGAVLDLFEKVFHHSSFTGRSGTMYGYEGLGCIYWHMVAKLLLAVQENCFLARESNCPATVRHGLQRMYFRVRSGLGYEKSAPEFGTFPTDPYSHTPGRGGAKQPGMTGQVKEEILTRWGELGVQVRDGAVSFHPFLLRATGFLRKETPFEIHDVQGLDHTLDLPADSIAFTYCQVPVVYQEVGEGPWLKVEFADGTDRRIDGAALDADVSAEIFGRTGRVQSLRVGVPREWLRQP